MYDSLSVGKHILANICYIFRDSGFRKADNSLNDPRCSLKVNGNCAVRWITNDLHLCSVVCGVLLSCFVTGWIGSLRDLEWSWTVLRLHTNGRNTKRC